ncbi:sensor histidine kinase [Kitasatospora sp. NPDC094015]|uniref:sensor histidine kinase n=1 Tax=Kitasatospora sp. NPDC094015 TaxID=3155205 RepID=UPI003326B833
MNPTPPAPGRTTAWTGAVLYALTLGLLVGGGPRASDSVHALAALLATGLLVPLVRRAPRAALVLTALGPALLVPATGGVGPGQFLAFLGMDVVLGVLVAVRPWRASVAVVAPSVALQVGVVAGFSHGPDELTGSVVVAVLAMVTAASLGLLARERREHAAELRSRAVADAVTAERLRIARELHDMVAHSIGIVAIQAGVGSRVIETQPAEARAALRAIEATSRETLAGLRRTLVALRRAEPEGGSAAEPVPLGPQPGLADLARLAEVTAEAGVRVELRTVGEPGPLAADLELAAYRIVQEAVTNVVRHAGTDHCLVTVRHEEGQLVVEVLDDGRGTAAAGPGRGFGLTGMRERVDLLHGEFGAGPRPGGGFRVTARLPLPVSGSGTAALHGAGAEVR